MWKKFVNNVLKDKKKRNGLLLVAALVILTFSTAVFFAMKNTGQLGPDQTQKEVTSDQVTKDTTDHEKDPEKDTQSEITSEQSTNQENSSSDQKKSNNSTANSKKNGTSKKSSSNSDKTAKNNEETKKPNLWDKIVDVIKGNGDKNDKSKKQYKVTFYTEGGSELKSRKVDEGTLIGSLPTPYRDEYIFVSWYYDKDRTKLASVKDAITSDITVYAEYAAQQPLEAVDTVNFASAEDVGTDFQIKLVSEDSTMDAASVRAAIDATNLTDPKQTDIIEVSGGAGSYTISGKNPVTEDGQMEPKPGFADGATYRIALNDSRLTFADQPETAREYNFTTAKEEVLNASLKDGIIYIPSKDVSNITNEGENVDTLSLALYEAETDGTLAPANLTQGQFDYTKDSLEVGDIVSIYNGLRPDERTLDTSDEENGDLAYIEITARNGNRYSYKNAAPEDVIFEPDVLPIPSDADQDEADDTITVDNTYLDFSSDVYANIDLDSQTTVDAGDFLMFYTGTFGKQSGEDAAQLESYAKIIAVQPKDEVTTIAYEEVSWEEVQEAMDIYAENTMSGEDMIEGVDTAELEAQIEQQALDSGFAEEAAQYLGSLALATENFTKLSENMNLEDYKVTLEDGSPVSPEELQLMASGFKAQCEMEDGYPKAKISVHPEHFGNAAGSAAKDKGLSVSLEVKANITIGKNGSSNQLKIEVSGKFVEEVGIDIGVRSKAIWKVWGIFPYIAEYRVTANVDVLNYTALEMNATMTTQSDDSTDNENYDKSVEIAQQIKELIDKSKDDGEDEDSEEKKNNLINRYSDMMNADSDWVRIVEQNIVQNKQQVPPPLPIIAISTEVNFVIKMDACMSIGFDFEYQTGKRYTYTVDVFAGAVSNDTVSLLEETYQFDFYAMGRLQVKAGLEFEFKIGLFSTDLDSVGFEAEAGAYTKLWGYFYYELHYAESSGRDQKYNGALLIDVGAYLELGFKAQAFSDTFQAECKLLDKEWSLWTIGRQDNVLDFATAEEEMPYIKLKQHVRDAVLPDSTFSMTYLDLKDGKEKQAVYDDEGNAKRQNFDIRMTNDKFTYDPKTNTVSVHPESGDKKLEGEMVITWIQYPMAFSSKPIQRTVSLYWDNLKDGYVIVPYTNGGTYLNIINAKFEAAIKQPADPERLGYDFAGWYKDEALTEAYEFPEKMPNTDVNIYAKWTPKTDIPYRVEYYQEQLRSGEYELVESDTLTGTTNSIVIPEAKEYIGYNTPAVQNLTVQADGSSVLRYYYSLQKHTVTFYSGEAGGEPVSYELKYGGKILAPMMAVKGYTFRGWDQEVVGTMGTENLYYTAQWTKDADTAYRVEYYVQGFDGRYKLQNIYEGLGFTKDEITAETLRDLVIEDETTAEQKFAVENGITFENMTVNGIACNTAVIEGSGKTVIKINYKREKHQVTFADGYDSGSGEKTTTQEALYGERVNIPNKMDRTGYTFAGWSVDGENTVTPSDKMSTEDIVYRALWTPNSYTLKFEKNNGTASGEMNPATFIYDSEQNLPANTFEADGYSFVGWSTSNTGKMQYEDGAAILNLTEKANEEITLYAVWELQSYTISYIGTELDGVINTNKTSYTVEDGKIDLMDPIRAGYTFTGWYDNESFTGEPVKAIEQGTLGDKIFYAKWEANTDTPYKVEHYIEKLEAPKNDQSAGDIQNPDEAEKPEKEYILAETEDLKGTTDSSVTPAVKDYPGFTAPETQTVTILADGSTYVRYEYSRNDVTITFDTDGGTLPAGTAEKMTGKYESMIELPVPVRSGYGFVGWYVDEDKFTGNTMPADDVTLKARWAAGQYGYTINYYLQDVDGSDHYTLRESVRGTAEMDSKIEGEIKEYAGFTAPEKAVKLRIGATDSKNVIDYKYTRNQYELSWDLNGGKAAEGYTEGKVYYDAPITAPTAVKPGYICRWNPELALKMPAEDLAYKAEWSTENYKVTMEANGGKVTGEGELSTKTVAFDDSYGDLPELVKDGYTFDGWYTEAEGGIKITEKTKVSIQKDHTLYAHFTPITYTITYAGIDGAENSNPEQYNIESDLITLADAKMTGFTFKGWYAEKECVGDPIRVIPANSTGNLTFYAKWSENHYTVIFHSNDEKNYSKEQNFAYSENKAFVKNSFVREGYTFCGWGKEPKGEVIYTDQQTIGGLSDADNDTIDLYAVWTADTYSIIYENMENAVNADDNPTEFTLDNNLVTLHDPSKPGYTFDGWYADSSFTKRVSGAITLDAPHDWIFYAKWKANLYTITFDSCLGITVPTETQLMTYDTEDQLTLLSEMGKFKRPGYTFAGWSREEGGAVEFTDGQTVKNVAESGNITLYAVWDLNIYTIKYDLGAGGISHTNPETYSIESGDVKLENPEAKEGYQFLGWFEGETPVTEIVKGTQKDYELKAKWVQGGIYNLSFEGAEKTTLKDGSDGYLLTYKVTRTLAEGTSGTPNPQHVYYRTVNGTAYGSTVDIDIAGDKYHFKHAGGEDVYLTFGPEDTEKTFTIEEWGSYAGADGAASSNANYTSRFYNVELYKVVDTVGTCQGTLGESTSYKRILDAEAGFNVNDYYKQWYTYLWKTGDPEIKNSSYNDNPRFWMMSMTQTLEALNVNPLQRQYINNNATGAGFYMTADMLEVEDGWVWLRLYTGATGYISEYVMDIVEGGWRLDVTFPYFGTKQNGVEFKYGGSKKKWGNTGTYNNGMVVNGSPAYACIRKDDQIQLELRTNGKKTNIWKLGTTDLHYKVLDTKAPEQIGLSSIALGKYAAGEQIGITVVYNEVINNVSDLGLSDIGIPITNVQYVAGEGTNALTFTATLTEDFEVTPDVNNAIKDLKPVTGTVKDVLGN